MVMYKIDRRGGRGVQKSFSMTDPTRCNERLIFKTFYTPAENLTFQCIKYNLELGTREVSMNGVGDPRRPLQGQVVKIHSLVHPIYLNESSSNINQIL